MGGEGNTGYTPPPAPGRPAHGTASPALAIPVFVSLYKYMYHVPAMCLCSLCGPTLFPKVLQCDHSAEASAFDEIWSGRGNEGHDCIPMARITYPIAFLWHT